MNCLIMVNLTETGPIYIHNRLNKEEPRTLEILNGSTVQNRDRRRLEQASSLYRTNT
jgi:hypothetical protein